MNFQIIGNLSTFQRKDFFVFLALEICKGYRNVHTQLYSKDKGVFFPNVIKKLFCCCGEASLCTVLGEDELTLWFLSFMITPLLQFSANLRFKLLFRALRIRLLIGNDIDCS